MQAALAAPGDLDASLTGPAQRITTLGPSGSYGEANAVILQGHKVLAEARPRRRNRVFAYIRAEAMPRLAARAPSSAREWMPSFR
ncbi:MAG TPA: hypothetical protein VNN79_16855 [Actinomycetota bacterium]|nr:hypothetical protein [Actinomycetota bacterium]